MLPIHFAIIEFQYILLVFASHYATMHPIYSFNRFMWWFATYYSTQLSKNVNPGPTTRRLRTFQLFTGISKFYVICWVDKTRQEAWSWALVQALVDPNTPRWRYSFFLKFYCQSFRWVDRKKCHGALWENRALGLSSGKSGTTLLCEVSDL